MAEDQFLFSTNINEIVGQIEAAFAKLQQVTAKGSKGPDLSGTDRFVQGLRGQMQGLLSDVNNLTAAQSQKIRAANPRDGGSGVVETTAGKSYTAQLNKAQDRFYGGMETILADLSKSNPAEASAVRGAIHYLYQTLADQVSRFARETAIPSLKEQADRAGVTTARTGGRSGTVYGDAYYGNPDRVADRGGKGQERLAARFNSEQFNREMERALAGVPKEVKDAIVIAFREAIGAISQVGGAGGRGNNGGGPPVGGADFGRFFSEFNRGQQVAQQRLRESLLGESTDRRKDPTYRGDIGPLRTVTKGTYYDSRNEQLDARGDGILGTGTYHSRRTGAQITDPTTVENLRQSLLSRETTYNEARRRQDIQFNRQRLKDEAAAHSDQLRQDLAARLRAGSELRSGQNAQGTARIVTQGTAFVQTGRERTEGYYANTRTGAPLKDGTPELENARRNDMRALERLQRAEDELRTQTEVLAAYRRGEARRVGTSQNFAVRDANGNERYATPSGQGYRYLDGREDRLRNDAIRDQDLRTQPRGIKQGFLQGLTSSGFGGGNGQINLGGVAQAAGNTVKYSVLYDTLNLVQQALTGVVAEVLNYDDSLANLNLALGDSGNANDAFLNSLGDIASFAGANIGDAMDVASQGMRAFGDEASSTREELEKVGTSFAASVSRVSLVSGQDLPTSSSQYRAILSGLGNTGEAPTNADFTSIEDAIAGAKQFGGDYDDILEGLQGLSTTGAEAGFTKNELANIASRVTAQTGQSGTLSGTRLARIFSIVGGNQGQNALSNFNQSLLPGQEQIDLSGTTADQLRQLSEGWEGYSEAQRKALGNSLAGTGNTKEFFTLMANGTKILETGGKSFDYLGKGMEEVEKRSEALTGQLRQIGGNIVNTFTAIARSGILDPLYFALLAINKATLLIRQGFQKFNEIPRPIKQVAGALLAVYAAMRLIRAISAAGGVRAFVANAASGAERRVNPTGFRNRQQNNADRELTRYGDRVAPRVSDAPLGPRPNLDYTRKTAEQKAREARDAARERYNAASAERRAAGADVRANGGNALSTARLATARAEQTAASRQLNTAERNLLTATQQAARARRQAAGGFGNRLRLDQQGRNLREGSGALRNTFGRIGSYLTDGQTLRSVRQTRLTREADERARGIRPDARTPRTPRTPDLNGTRQLAAQLGGSLQRATDSIANRLRGQPASASLAAEAQKWSQAQAAAAQNVAEANRQLTAIRNQKVNPNDARAVAQRGADLRNAQALVTRSEQQLRAATAGTIRAQAAADASARPGVGGAAGRGVARVAERVGTLGSTLASRAPDRLASALRTLDRPFAAVANGATRAATNLRGLTTDLRTLSRFGPTVREGFRDLTSGQLGTNIANSARRTLTGFGNVIRSQIGLIGGIFIGIGLLTSALQANSAFRQAAEEASAGLRNIGNVADLTPDEARREAESRTQEGEGAVEAGKGIIGGLIDYANGLFGQGRLFTRASDRIKQLSDQGAAALNKYADALEEQQKSLAVSANAEVDLSSQEALQNSLQLMSDGGRSAGSQLDAFNRSLDNLITNVQRGTNNLSDEQKTQITEAAGAGSGISLTNILDKSVKANDRYTTAAGDLADAGATKGVGAITTSVITDQLANGADLATDEGKKKLNDALKKQYSDYFQKQGLGKTDADKFAKDLADQVSKDASEAAVNLTSIADPKATYAQLAAQGSQLVAAQAEQAAADASLSGATGGGALYGAQNKLANDKALLERLRTLGQADVDKIEDPKDKKAAQDALDAQLEQQANIITADTLALQDAKNQHFAVLNAYAASLVPSTDTVGQTNTQIQGLEQQIANTTDADAKLALQTQLNQLEQQRAQQVVQAANAERTAAVNVRDAQGTATADYNNAAATLQQIADSGDTTSQAYFQAKTAADQAYLALMLADIDHLDAVARAGLRAGDEVGNALADYNTAIAKAKESTVEGSAERAAALRAVEEGEGAAARQAQTARDTARRNADIDPRDTIASDRSEITDLEAQIRDLPEGADTRRAELQKQLAEARRKLADDQLSEANAARLASVAGYDTVGQARVATENALATLRNTMQGTQAYYDAQREYQDALFAQAQADIEAQSSARLRGVRVGDTLGELREAARKARELAGTYAEGTKERDDADRAAAEADLRVRQEELATRQAQRSANVFPTDSLGGAIADVENARDALEQAIEGTKEYYEAQKALRDAQYALAQAQADAAAAAFRLTIDLTNPVAAAQAALKEAQAKLDAAAGAPDSVRNPLIEAVRNAETAADQAAFQQRLSDAQIADQLGRISHAAYLQYLQNEHDRLTEQLAGMDETTNGYRQAVDQLNQIDQLIQDAKKSLNQQFNLQDVTLPTLYEVRRAVGVSADQIRSQVVDYSSTQGTVIINGADMATVVAYINKTLGTGSTAVYTTSPRRV